MHYGLDRQAEIWIQELEEKLSRKLEAECRRLGSMMPYVPENGVYYDMGARELNAWTNGFFAGMMWQSASKNLQNKSKKGWTRL